MKEVKEALTRLDEVYAAYADPDADFDALAAEQAKLEGIIQAADGHNLERTLRWPLTLCVCPLGRQGKAPVRRGTPPSGLVPPVTLQTRHVTVGRTHQPPGRRKCGLAGALPPRLPRHRGGNYPRPLLPGQCCRLDPELDRGHGIPYEGNYTNWLETKEKRLAIEEKQEVAHQKAIKSVRGAQ